MKVIPRLVSVLALLVLALPANPGGVLIGIVTDDCTTPVDPSAGRPGDQAELLAFKVPATGDCTDILFDIRATGDLLAGGTDAVGLLWGMPANWRTSIAAAEQGELVFDG